MKLMKQGTNERILLMRIIRRNRYKNLCKVPITEKHSKSSADNTSLYDVLNSSFGTSMMDHWIKSFK